MIISKYLQKLFFLLMVGGALCTLQACGDDEEDESVQKPNEEETVKPDDGKEEEKPSDKPSDTMEAVDLGLSVKWATCNVGASKPEEYGDRFAWGETTTKSDYSWETYKWCNGTDNTMTKYCTDNDYGTMDNLTTLTSSDDVATVKWGNKWRMPTVKEMIELNDDCIWTWTTQNEVNGWNVEGPNGNSIFLPSASKHGSEAYYWSATLLEGTSYLAYEFYFFDGLHSWNPAKRYSGKVVRPVCD